MRCLPTSSSCYRLQRTLCWSVQHIHLPRVANPGLTRAPYAPAIGAQIGLTGTPLGTKVEDFDKLLAVIKGDVNANANDEGFVSYFMERPSAVFAPLHMPGMLPKEAVLPGVLALSGLTPGPSAIRSFELQNFESKDKGNLAAYYKQMDGSLDDSTLAPRCSIGQSFGYAGSAKVRWIRFQCVVTGLICIPHAH